jgi:glycosyltransferase involved in cell wall biosynthesis
MSRLFVIPCKFNRETPYVIECVQRIRRFHPDDDILVVDSASDDTGYFEDIAAPRVTVADIQNKFYATGAHHFGYATQRHDFFYMLADSVWLNAPLPSPETLTVVRWFGYPTHAWGVDESGVDLAFWGEEVLRQMSVPVPETYRGILGPYMWGPQFIFDDLDFMGFFNTLPKDKWQQCALERVAGIVLTHLGYDVANSLQGEHLGHSDAYDEAVVTKLNPGRM